MQKAISSPAAAGLALARLARPETAALALALIGIGLLLGAFGFEYVVGIKPCPLCLEQRLPWPLAVIAAGTALFGLRPEAPKWLAPTAFAVAAALTLWSAYLAGFHAGVEWKWWPGPPECSGTGIEVSDDVFSNLRRGQIVRCDDIAWSLFGLSLAGYNFLFSLAALALAAVGFAKTWKART